MYLQHFGLKHNPLGKITQSGLVNEQYQRLIPYLDWLLETRGIGVITGESGVGKTTAVRQWVQKLNPLTHQVYYQADNHFKPFDIYSQLADQLGLDRSYRYAVLWRSLKAQLLHLQDEKKITPIWILDEAHLLPMHFFAQLPSFLNFSFDTREIMIILLVGTPKLDNILQRHSQAALASRTHFRFEWKALEDVAQFSGFIKQAFEQAGCQQPLFSQSGINSIHMASKGRLRFAQRIITRCLQIACAKKFNHVNDDIVHESIEQLQIVTH